MTDQNITEYIEKMTSGTIRKIKIEHTGRSKRAVIEYAGHREAAMARRDLCVFFDNMGNELSVDWEKPSACQNATLFVSDMSSSTKKEDLEALFSFNGHLTIKQIRLVKGYAFIQYSSHYEAAVALGFATSHKSFGQNLSMEGGWSRLHVAWSNSTQSTGIQFAGQTTRGSSGRNHHQQKTNGRSLKSRQKH